MYEIFITNTTVEPFHWTTTRGSGLMKELKFARAESAFGMVTQKRNSSF